MIKLLTPADYDAYNEFLELEKSSSIYHTLEWKKVLEETYGFRPAYILHQTNTKITGVLPLFYINTLAKGKRLISLPFSHHVPTLADSPDTDIQLINESTDFARKHGCRYLEIKTAKSQVVEHLATTAKCQALNFNTAIDLTVGLDSLWSKFHKKRVKYAINRAEKYGLTISNNNDIQDYLIFYNIELLTRKRQGSPMYSKRFFRSLHANMATNGLSKCYIAFHNTTPIAGAIIFKWKDTFTYGYACSLLGDEFSPMNANHFLLWHSIKDALAMNGTFFDLGSTPIWHESLLRYKSGWGGSTEKLEYTYIYPFGKAVRHTDRKGIPAKIVSGLLKVLPASVNAFVGPHILKSLA